MSKQSKRTGRAARDVHAAIRASADALRASRRAGYHVADDEFPEVAALLRAAFDAVAAGVPRYVTFMGRAYWLRVRLAAQIDIFAAPGDAVPLLRGARLSTDGHGHAPGH